MTTVWGMGRRACPGRQLAESSLFIAMASVVACFDIAPKPGDTPRELTFTSGFIRCVRRAGGRICFRWILSRGRRNGGTLSKGRFYL
ncbi:hypothetical protein JB92DRAFT_3006736 [Gautieria morchelliformis]|nr:hypothetical protein JB92DRAFT_3006736 [Gautieria morchelliformis]